MGPAPKPKLSQLVPASSTQYDESVKRRSIDDPLRQHRRSSIPFADRTPAVRFIRAIDQRKASLAGPYGPTIDEPSKTILKKSDHPIIVSPPPGPEAHRVLSETSHISTTNDELDTCRIKAELIMDKISRAERIARGAMDVFTFPTATRRVEALSRLQGCVTMCVCIIRICTMSEEFKAKSQEKNKEKRESCVNQLQLVIDRTQKMKQDGKELFGTAKQFLHISKRRYNDWENLFKRNNEFRIDHSKLSYPIYTHKRMPESVTLFEDTLEEHHAERKNRLDGQIRAYRKFPEGSITIHCDMAAFEDNLENVGEFVNFEECHLETQVELIHYITSHTEELLYFGGQCMCQALQAAQDQEIDDSFKFIQSKINTLEYDTYFDPLCALELKTALGELVMRKAELLNTAEQILDHCRHVVDITKAFNRYAKRTIDGKSQGCSCCGGPSKYKSLLNLLGVGAIDDVIILMPLTVDIAQDVFQITTFQVPRDSETGSGAQRISVMSEENKPAG